MADEPKKPLGKSGNRRDFFSARRKFVSSEGGKRLSPYQRAGSMLSRANALAKKLRKKGP